MSRPLAVYDAADGTLSNHLSRNPRAAANAESLRGAANAKKVHFAARSRSHFASSAMERA
jgi:hypothetical protein